MLSDQGRLEGEGRKAPRTRVDDGGPTSVPLDTKTSRRLDRTSTTTQIPRPFRVPFLTTENTKNIPP